MIESRIYIGADNETQWPDEGVIEAWAKAVLGNYTMQHRFGTWEGAREDCILLIYVGKPISETHLLELKEATKQDCILVTEAQVKVRMI